MDTKVRKLITCHRIHHPRVDRESLHLKRENSRQGLTQLKLTYKTTTIGLKKYLYTTTDLMLWLVNTHKRQKKKYSRFGLVWFSLFNGISTLFRLFNAKAILLEEQ